MFALLAGTVTTFSVVTPLKASIITELFHVTISRTTITLVILVITFFIYIYSLLHGFKGISILAYVLIFGDEARYIIDRGGELFGRMVQNFIGLSTFTNP